MICGFREFGGTWWSNEVRVANFIDKYVMLYAACDVTRVRVWSELCCGEIRLECCLVCTDVYIKGYINDNSLFLSLFPHIQFCIPFICASNNSRNIRYIWHCKLYLLKWYKKLHQQVISTINCIVFQNCTNIPKNFKPLEQTRYTYKKE